MMKPHGLGEQELELLRYVSDHAPVTVRETADNYGVSKGLARTTILTVMERLRKKGFLERSHTAVGFAYAPVQQKQALLTQLVGEFVDRTLEGSITPFVSYLADSRGLSPEETDVLRKLLNKVN